LGAAPFWLSSFFMRGAFIAFMAVVASAVVGCATTSGDDVESSSDEINGDAVRVTRVADGGFRIQSSLAARCDGCADVDRDGLNDAWEDAVLAKLTPFVTFDEDEPLMNGDNRDAFAAIGRVFPSGDRVVVSVIFLYTRDYGAANPVCFSTHNHAGDAERAALELEITGGGDAVSRAAYTTGHEGTEDDQTTIVRDGEQKRLEDVGGRWRVYSSQKKHATYMTKEHCESAKFRKWTHQFCGSEDCAPDEMSDDDKARFTRLPRVLNVGELDAPRGENDDLGRLGFEGVRAWSDERFCGGVKGLSAEEIAKCPDGLRAKLPKNPFAQ
jgi:hypothetical protein